LKDLEKTLNDYRRYAGKTPVALRGSVEGELMMGQEDITSGALTRCSAPPVRPVSK